MAVDEQSSQDSTLIDDDLVAALGFEPVTTIEGEASTSDAPSNGAVATASTAFVDDAPVDDSLVADDDGIPVDEVALGDVADESDASLEVLDDVSTNGDHDGFGIDEISDADDVSEGLDGVSSDVEARRSFFDLDSTDLDSTDLDSTDLDRTDLDSGDDGASDRVDLDVDAVHDTDHSGADPDGAVLESDAAFESEMAAVPSLVDPDLDGAATAPVGLIDLDTDGLDTDGLDADVIDLDTMDLSDPGPDEISTEGFADEGVQELADADSVFADATPVLDPPSFDDAIGHAATETVDVGSGLLDLEAAEESIGTAAVATEATSAASSKSRRRLRARKSRRVIRHIDPWSVLTFSVLFHMVVFAALLLSSVLVWNAAIASGMVENIESFIQELGDYETFEINADVMFRAAIVIAGMLTLASSVLVVLLTVVFNLISDLVGGIRVTVIEEETVRVPIDKKRSKARNE